MKKILGILVAGALLVSTCSLFFTTAAEDTTGNAGFTAQHAYVDFENYNIDTTLNHFKNTNLNVNQWSIADESKKYTI